MSLDRTRRAFHQTSSVWSLLVSSWKMVAPSVTTTSRKSQHCTWSFVCEVACRSLWRRWLARPSLLRWNPATLLRMWRPRFRYCWLCTWCWKSFFDGVKHTLSQIDDCASYTMAWEPPASDCQHITCWFLPWKVTVQLTFSVTMLLLHSKVRRHR